MSKCVILLFVVLLLKMSSEHRSGNDDDVNGTSNLSLNRSSPELIYGISRANEANGSHNFLISTRRIYGSINNDYTYSKSFDKVSSDFFNVANKPIVLRKLHSTFRTETRPELLKDHTPVIANDKRSNGHKNHIVTPLHPQKHAESQNNQIAGKKFQKYGNLQIIIDIDDTIKSSGGMKLFSIPLFGGIDDQYDSGEYYPGAIQFITEMATYELPVGSRPLDIAVLTARIPAVPILKSSHLNGRFVKAAKLKGIPDWGIDCDKKVLYCTVNQWIFQSTKAEKKFENFLELHNKTVNQIPDVRYIWIGDTGEMDRQVGEMMAINKPKYMRAIFLHYVKEEAVTDNMADDFLLNDVPIVFFRTYISAALKAQKLQLLDIPALRRISIKAMKEIKRSKINFNSTKYQDLIKDLSAAQRLLEIGDVSSLTIDEIIRSLEEK